MDAGEGEEVNIEELVGNLTTYKDQLQQVRMLLNDDARNTEYLDMEKELVEVISLTEELLATAKQGEEGSSRPALNDPSTIRPFPGSSSAVLPKATAGNGIVFPVGSRVEARWSGDGGWFVATVEAVTPNGYLVCYEGYGNKEVVDPSNVRPIENAADPLLEAERVAVATKEALKRKIAEAATHDFETWTIPQKLRIEPNDPDDVKAAKRKKLHAFKSKMRMEAKEATQNKRQNAWQQFQTTKGSAKKIGFFSGRKRESIFKSPEDPFGKVGVTGSGKGLTEFQKREKHLHLKGANMEGSDD